MKIAVIGAGPAGYCAALELGRLGADVTLFEKKELGGVCLNWGCIPTKTLYHGTSEFLRLQKLEGKGSGVSVSNPSLNWKELQAHRQAVTDKMVSGIAALLKNRAVETIFDEVLVEPGEKFAVVSKKDGKLHGNYDKVLLAAGSVPLVPKGLDGLTHATELLFAETVPDELVLIGGGVIGVEMATIFASAGTKVTVMEIMPKLVSTEDTAVSMAVSKALKKLGVEVVVSSGFPEISGSSIKYPDKNLEFDKNKVFNATGMKPAADALCRSLDIEISEKGHIKVDEQLMTSQEGIYAAGDLLESPALAHVGSHEGVVAARNIMGMPEKVHYKAVPRAIFTIPPVAAVGATESSLKDSQTGYSKGRFMLAANGMANGSHKTEGFVQTLVSEEGKILGAVISSPHAEDLLASLAVAVETGIKAEEYLRTMHFHPSLSECVWESVAEASGTPLHKAIRKK